ncbi:MAG: HAMP domain-containing histidine kinase [Eubacterium sp.]|nr:HAMP domain-containing histidine kinase [Eubacterium sp.]
MKFRHKVLFLNLLLLSLTTGVVGFLLMKRSYRLTMDTAIKSAVTENNLVQSSVEYEILDAINSGSYNLNRSLPTIGNQIFSGMISGEEALAIRYGDFYVYTSEEEFPDLTAMPVKDTGTAGGEATPDTAAAAATVNLFDFSNDAKKNYLLTEEGGRHFLYVTSNSTLDEKPLNIITRRDISDVHAMLDQSVREYREITLLILSLSALLLYILSRLLTRPLESLRDTTDSFAEGDYSVRSKIRTADEVGMLSDRFNSMADSVENHVEELNDMIHRREQFVADFTHEIKTPMTSIIGYADTMRSLDLSKDEQQQALGYIFSEGKRLESMSMKLFDLLYLKDHPIEKKKISAEALAESVKTSMTPLLTASGQTLSVNVVPGFLEGDAELLKTVFINLIDNARKASKEGDTVLFSGSPAKDPSEGSTSPASGESGSISGKGSNTTDSQEAAVYRFTVCDHGIGIPEEDQKKIFDEFFMVDKSRTRAAGGAGLGMSLVTVILERHGAKIDLESKPGEGTTFTVTFNAGSE